ncbi:hypothetical protein PTKIN_Ptkin15bG0087700 [Pterospermum kingtungense]
MQVDLVGGYYDAGDNVKFGFPMAFNSAVGLLITFSKQLHIQTPFMFRLVMQTRPFLSGKTRRHGHSKDCFQSETAAASLVFRRSDPTYSKLLVRRAIKDELLWGAVWLHRATKNPTYLNYIQVNRQTLGAAEFDNTYGWDNKHVGARIILSKAFLVQRLQSLHDYKGHADNFIGSLIPNAPFSSAKYTPGRLLFKMSDSNMQYVTSTSFLLLTYAKYLTSAH